jgi:hypothetical protein
VRTDRYPRPLTAYAALVNLAFGGIDAILVVFLVRKPRTPRALHRPAASR